MSDVIAKKPSPEILELFDNPYPGRDFLITHVCPEFTSLCPKTGQPDYGTITFEYIADKLCVELKSLKFYLQAYRNEGVFYERLTNQILDDMVAAMKPRYIKVTADFTPRRTPFEDRRSICRARMERRGRMRLWMRRRMNSSRVPASIKKA